MVELFFDWYFSEVPSRMKKIWGNYVWFFSKYFAISDLVHEFFAPWKGLTFSREKRNFEIGDALSAWFGNIISRVIGAIMRSFFLGAGIGIELGAFIFGIVAFIIWAGLFFSFRCRFLRAFGSSLFDPGGQ